MEPHGRRQRAGGNDDGRDAAMLSGSIGLLNDAIDTLVDGLSNLLVYVGVRRNRERAVSVVLAVFMLATAAFTLFEAISRLVAGEAVRPDAFAAQTWRSSCNRWIHATMCW